MINNIVKIIASSAAGQVISIILLPIVAKIYGPTVLGGTSVIQSSAMILAIVFSLKIDNLIISSNENKSKDLRELFFFWSIFLLLVGGAAVFLIIENNFFSEKIIFDIIFCLLAAFFVANFDICKSVCVRQRIIGNIAFVSAFRSPLLPILQIILYYLLPINYASNVAYVFSCYVVFFIIKNFPQKISYSYYFLNYKKYLNTLFVNRLDISKNLVLGALNYTNNFGLPIFMAVIFGGREAGLIALAMRIVGVPVALIGRAVADVFVGRAVLLVDDFQNLRKEVIGVCVKLTAFSAVPTFIIFLLPERIYVDFLGSDWIGIKYSICLVWFIGVMQLVVGSVAQILLIIKCESFLIFWEIVRGCFCFIGLYLMSAHKFDYRETLLFYSLAMCFFYFVLGVKILKKLSC